MLQTNIPAADSSLASLDGKERQSSVENDRTTIAAASLLRVLEGAVVATKAPDAYFQPISYWIQHHGISKGNDSPIGTIPTDSKSALDLSLPFTDWHAAIISNPVLSEDGVKQLIQVVLAVSLLREKARHGLEVDTASLDTIWSLVYSAITTAEGTDLQFTVSRSAQGFLAVPLCSLLNNGRIEELWRLHTWLPDGQRGVSEEVCIHAHQPFGQSWTLLGNGTDCTFDVDTPDDPLLATHAAYECCYAGADGTHSAGGSEYQTHQISSTIRNTGRLVRVKPGGKLPHGRDMSYTVPGGAYHRSIVSGSRLHATLFVFDSSRGYDDDAAVLGPKDGGELSQPRDPAGITPEALAHMVGATRRWEQHHEVKSEGDVEHDTVMGYYRLFRGLGLLKKGREEDAMRFLRPGEGCSPMEAFKKEPSEIHSEYVKKLVEVGAVDNIEG